VGTERVFSRRAVKPVETVYRGKALLIFLDHGNKRDVGVRQFCHQIAQALNFRDCLTCGDLEAFQIG